MVQFLPVALSANHVHHAKGSDDIRDQTSLEHLPNRSHAKKTRRTHPHPVRTTAAVADEIKPQLSVAAFDHLIHFTARDLYPFDHELEVVHQPFDVPIDIFLLRQHDAWIINTNGTIGNLIERLLNDTHALLDFRKTHRE